MAERLEFEPDLFALHGTPEQLAEYFNIEGQSSLKKLIHEMTRRFDSPDAEERRRGSITHRALAALNWQRIYTTNYDAHVEGALGLLKMRGRSARRSLRSKTSRLLVMLTPSR
jgi:hypothetical protein